MRAGKSARGSGKFFDLLWLVEESENLCGQLLGGKFLFGDEPAGTGARHFLRVTQLVAVGGSSEGDKDSGATRGCDFRCGDGSCSANDHICPGKALRHVRQEGDNLRVNFAPRVRGAYSIIVAVAGLMHNGEFVLAPHEAVHRIHKNPIDRQRALATASDQQTKWLLQISRRNRKKLRPHGTPGNNCFVTPDLCRNFIAGCDSLGDSRQHLVRKTRLGIWFEDDIRHAPKPSRQKHRPSSVATDSECRHGLMFSKYATRI